MALQFYILDTETTGLDASVHETVQISIIRTSDRVQITRNIKALYPERADIKALEITNKTRDDLLKGSSREEVVDLFTKFLEEDGLTPEHRCIAAHNSSFDYRFINALWTSVDKIFPAHLWLCTKELSRLYAKKQGIAKPKLTLKASMELTGVKSIPISHTAVNDTQNTFFLWEKLMASDLDYMPLIKRKVASSNNVESSVESLEGLDF